MNIETVQAKVAEIKAMTDFEERHVARDGLFVAILREGATGRLTARKWSAMAGHALALLDPDIPVWYA